MNRCRKRWVLMALVALVATTSAVSAQTRQIPISEYLAMYDYAPAGYPCLGWVPGIYFNPDTPDIGLQIDVLGTRLASCGGSTVGTTVDGNVTVRRMEDGRAYVTVTIRTTNALVWGWNAKPRNAANIAYGYRPADVAAGATPALGRGMYRVEFTMASVDTPLPPLWLVGSSEFPRHKTFLDITADGPLRARSGYPDGTPGLARVVQLWLVDRAAGVEEWPVELAFYKPLGR